MGAITTAVINMKGGVGKTTLTINLAACLAEKYGKRVLVVDLDPQFNATQYLMPEEQYKNYIELVNQGKKALVTDIFKRRYNSPSIVNKRAHKAKSPPLAIENFTITYPTFNGKLDVVPSHLELMDLPYTKRGTENRLERFINKLALNKYDFIFIDCPPTMSIFTLAAYIAANAILIPVKPDYMSSFGLPLLQRAMEEYREDTGNEPAELGVVFSMVNLNTNLMKEGIQRVKESNEERGTYVFEHLLRHGTSIAEAVESNTPIFRYPKAKEYWEDIFAITEEFLGRINQEFDEAENE